jgi:hypothetical protein
VRSLRAAASIWLLGASVYLVCEAVAAAGAPGYSYVGDYISSLGGSAVMNLGAFVAHGALFLLGAVVATRGAACGRGFVAAAAVNAAGNVVIAVFPSGEPASAPWHGVGAAMAILGGNVAVILAGRAALRSGAPPSYGWISLAIGAFGLLCVSALVLGGSPAGLIERGSVYSIVGWELYTAVVILAGRFRR